MLDLCDTIENTTREFQRGRARRAVVSASDTGAAESDWRNARDVAAEIAGRAPEWPESEIDG